ncbi:MAG: DUF4251 domain-containing protein [Bacteroidetes bacterium]|nr:DUF4251 domain-containing protein [Bacteroidota bacterium]
MYIFPACTATKHPVEVVGASEDEIKQAIAEDRWIFVANQAMPQSGRSRILTSRYTMLCKKDTIISVLPYFGRAYYAPIGETTSPLDFTSSSFVLTKDVDKKGRWNIAIKPNDNREVQSFNFSLFTNGSAQLSVQMKNRSPINFSGNVAPVK